MNENTDSGDKYAGNKTETDALALLIRAGGRREAPPDEAYQQVLAATQSAWQRKVRRRTYWRVANAIAASVAVAAILIGVATLRSPGPALPVQVAVSDVIRGSVMVHEDGSAQATAIGGAGAAVMSGSRIRTGRDSGAGLLVGDGLSLRLDESTEIAFETDSRVRLLAGAVYVDTGPGADPGSTLDIATAAGVFRHVGTQFEVRRLGDVHRLRVREGLVTLQGPSEELETVAGGEIALRPDGSFRRALVSAHDPDWRWVHALAPAPYVEDQSLAELLSWVSRETGRVIRFSDPALAVAAAQTTLHGSRQRLLPMEALTVMLATTDFRYSISADGDILLEAER